MKRKRVSPQTNLDSRLSLFRTFPDVHTMGILIANEKQADEKVYSVLQTSLHIYLPSDLTTLCLRYSQVPVPAVPTFLSQEKEETKEFLYEWVAWYTTKTKEQLTLREWLNLVQLHFADPSDSNMLDPTFDNVSIGETEVHPDVDQDPIALLIDEDGFRFGVRNGDNDLSFLVTRNTEGELCIHSEEKKDNCSDIFLTGATVRELTFRWKDQTLETKTNPHSQFLNAQTKDFLLKCAKDLSRTYEECMALSMVWNTKTEKENLVNFKTLSAKISQIADDVVMRKESLFLWHDSESDHESGAESEENGVTCNRSS